MLRIIAWIFFIILFCLALVFIIPNTQLVTLNYYSGEIKLSFAIILFITLCIGTILGVLFNLMWLWGLRRQNQLLRKEIKQQQKKINTLRVQSDQDNITS